MTEDTPMPPDMRARLRDWFVAEMEVTDATTPVSSPPLRLPEPDPPEQNAAGRWRRVVATAAVLVMLVAGLVALNRRDVDQPQAPAPTTGVSPPTVVASSVQLDVATILTDACGHLREESQRLSLAGDAAEIEQVSTALVAALDRADVTLSHAAGDVAVDEIRGLLADLRSRAVDLPAVAAMAADRTDPLQRTSIEQAINNVDLLLAALGRAMERSGGECADLPALRKQP
jgi:hypothetical protein